VGKFNFSPGPTAEPQFKLDLLFAMAPYGIVFQLLDSCSAVHELTAPVSACIQLPSDMSSGSQAEQT
jgi:hypothetical protein